MAPILNSPTDPLEVLCDRAVQAIRRHVNVLHGHVAAWDLPEWDHAPAHGYIRPQRHGWGY